MSYVAEWGIWTEKTMVRLNLIVIFVTDITVIVCNCYCNRRSHKIIPQLKSKYCDYVGSYFPWALGYCIIDFVLSACSASAATCIVIVHHIPRIKTIHHCSSTLLYLLWQLMWSLRQLSNAMMTYLSMYLWTFPVK